MDKLASGPWGITYVSLSERGSTKIRHGVSKSRASARPTSSAGSIKNMGCPYKLECPDNATVQKKWTLPDLVSHLSSRHCVVPEPDHMNSKPLYGKVNLIAATLLVWAAGAGETHILDWLFKDSKRRGKLELKNADQTGPHYGSTTALMKAAEHRQFKVIETLRTYATRSCGIKEVDLTNDEGFTALHLAVESRYHHVVDAIIHLGADVNKRVANDILTPLSIALDMGPPSWIISQRLFRAGAQVEPVRPFLSEEYKHIDGKGFEEKLRTMEGVLELVGLG